MDHNYNNYYNNRNNDYIQSLANHNFTMTAGDGSTTSAITPTTTTSTTANTGTYFSYSIPGMDIAAGPLIFTYVSEFLSFITPKELPLELLHEALHSNVTFIDLATNAIKIESGFIVIMSIFAILALVPLIATCCWCCSSRSPEEEHQLTRHASVMIVDETLQESLKRRKSASVTTLWIVFIFLTFSDICMFYANSRLATSVQMTPEMIKSTMHDMEVFLKDTHLQIKHKLDNGFHVSVEKVIKDLEDVDVLLGEPIQAEISAHTGIELAYDSLATISLANAELIYRVLMLQETVGRALKISQESAARMEELQIQLSVLQRQCTYRDRPLCDTLRIRSFEENGIIDALKTLQEDQSVFRMRYLGEIEFGATVKNLTSEVGVSRSIFSNFPQQVKHDTSYQRNYTLEQLDNIRHRTTANAQMLTSTITAMLERLQGTWESLEPKYQRLQEWTNIYWTTGWIAAMVIIWVLLFMSMSYCFFLCESNIKAGVVIFIAVLIICIGSICITLYGLLTLTIGGNAEVFICRPLYHTKNILTNNGIQLEYDMLGKLFDKPGYLYANEPQMGIIGDLLRPAGVHRPIVNVSLGNALRGCEENQASYNVFQLDAFVNTTQIADLKQFPKVTTAIDAIAVSERTLLSLTQTIQNILANMLQISSFNLTIYRTSIGAPTPEKDLATFIDQMQRVALQIQDVATSSRMTTLGSRAKRLQASLLQPLEQLQNEILYHLTALELQRDPWAKQVNQTLNHLRNIQGYLEKTAGEICHNQTRIYTERLKTYLTSSKATMSSQLGDTTAKCRPFYDIFDANRTFLCRNIVDYLNALWFFAFFTLLLWSIATPVGLNLISIQQRITAMGRAQKRAAERRNSHHMRDSRRHERGSSTPRERSTSSTAGRQRPQPQIRRTATEETLDLSLDDEVTSHSHPHMQQQQQRERETRSRERETSRPRGSDSTAPTTPARSRGGRLQRGSGEDNWVSSGHNRGPSHERESSQARMSATRQQRTVSKPPLARQSTDEFDIDEENDNSNSNWSPQQQQQQQQHHPHQQQQPKRFEVRQDSSRREPIRNNTNGAARNKPKLRHTEKESYERDNRRSMTPILPVRPDSQPALPMPRTPTHLRNRVSLTTRAVANIVRASHSRNKPLVHRLGTEDYDMDEAEIYGANSAAVAAAQRTPPRTAPPPPPPPNQLNRYGSIRSIHFNAEEDMEFEDVESANPIYANAFLGN